MNLSVSFLIKTLEREGFFFKVPTSYFSIHLQIKRLSFLCTQEEI